MHIEPHRHTNKTGQTANGNQRNSRHDAIELDRTEGACRFNASQLSSFDFATSLDATVHDVGGLHTNKHRRDHLLWSPVHESMPRITICIGRLGPGTGPVCKCYTEMCLPCSVLCGMHRISTGDRPPTRPQCPLHLVPARAVSESSPSRPQATNKGRLRSGRWPHCRRRSGFASTHTRLRTRMQLRTFVTLCINTNLTQYSPTLGMCATMVTEGPMAACADASTCSGPERSLNCEPMLMGSGGLQPSRHRPLSPCIRVGGLGRRP